MDSPNPREWSSIAKKFVSGLTGAGLVVFLFLHLSGNLTIFLGKDAFNVYSHGMVTMWHGAFIILADLGLVLFFGGHAISGISVARQRRRSRPVRYEVVRDAGGPSQKSRSSVTMVISGLALLVFVGYHVYHFKFGPGVEAGYTAKLPTGETIRDIHRLVIEEFRKPVVAVSYVVAMLFLGLHLRHGFWSMFQSLGANNPKFMPWLVRIGWTVAILLAFGFLGIPLYILFGLPLPADTALAAGVLA